MNTNHLDDDLVDQFIKISYGEGNYNGKYCFFGMEGGGGNCFDKMNNYLRTGNARFTCVCMLISRMQALGICRLLNAGTADEMPVDFRQ